MTVCYQIGADKGWSVISYIPDRSQSPILIECPIPFLAAGNFLSPKESLKDKWIETFRETKAEWFLPLLRRMAAGEQVSLTEIQQAHQVARGTPLQRTEDPRDLSDNDNTSNA
jgi:hypothetical protein